MGIHWKGRSLKAGKEGEKRRKCPKAGRGRKGGGKRLAEQTGRKEEGRRLGAGRKEEGRRFWVSPLTRNVLQLYSIFSEILGCHGGY